MADGLAGASKPSLSKKQLLTAEHVTHRCHHEATRPKMTSNMLSSYLSSLVLLPHDGIDV